jgi:hypothetical protein
MTAYSIYSQLPSISGGLLLHPQPEDVPCHGDKGMLAIICPKSFVCPSHIKKPKD